MGDAVRAMGPITGLFGYRRPGIGVGAAVEIELAAAGNEGPILFHSRLQGNLGSRLANRLECLLGAEGDPDRPAGQP